MSLRSAGVGSGAMASSSTLPGSGKAIWFLSHEFMVIFVENYLWGMVLNLFIEVLH